MRTTLIIAATIFLAACGKSNEEQLQDAANQSDPAAAEVLNNAAEAGTPPQEVLQEAGNAVSMTKIDTTPPPAEARRNTPNRPNPQSGQPVENTVANGR